MIKLYTDGASRGNPGQAAAGAVAFINDTTLFEISETLGLQTNNYAEYKALILALRELIKLNLTNEEVRVYADSKLMVEQVNGSWKVKNENIKPLYKEVLQLKNEFGNISFTHVDRSLNKLADALANKALDS